MKNNKSAKFSTHEIARRFAKSFLDILILQLIKTEPAWGYDIIRKTETLYKVKLRHGALYPMLNKLETEGLVKSRREVQQGRVRKVYEITKGGTALLQAYNDFTEAFAKQESLDDSSETSS